MKASEPPLLVDVVMSELRERVKARLRAEIAHADPSSPLLAPGVFDQAALVLGRAAEPRRLLLLPALLSGTDELKLETSLRFTSHRPRSGSLIIWVKCRLLLPLVRWLYEFSRDNFVRQDRTIADIDRHRGGGHPPTPATPPCVRVRTRRFELVTLALLNQ